MLTIVPFQTQLWLQREALTLVTVPTLQDRLTKAMNHATLQRVDLAKACGISSAAVTKWFNGQTKNLAMAHLFAVADACRVNARWLGTGQGEMGLDKKADPYADIPQRRIDLIRMYGRLPDETRRAIRHMIETLAWVTHPAKGQYEKNQQQAISTRDRKALMVHDK